MLRLIFMFADLIEIYKPVHGLSAISFEDLLQFDNIDHTSPEVITLLKKRCRLDLRLYFLFERVRRQSMGLFMDNFVRSPRRPPSLLVGFVR